MTMTTNDDSSNTKDRHYVWWSIPLFAVFLLLFLWIGWIHSYEIINGKGYWLPSDDYMVSQQYGKNLAQGKGLVFNPGERVEGFTNPLVVLAISLPIELLGIPANLLGLAVNTVHGIFFALIGLYLLFGGQGRKQNEKIWPGIVVSLVFLTLPHNGYYAYAGFSVYQQAFLLVFLAFHLHSKKGRFYIALALLPLLHAMCIPLWAGFSALRLYINRQKATLEFGYLTLAAIPLAAYFLFRWNYYGEIFPNTYYLKGGGVESWIRGLKYLFSAAFWLMPMVLLLVLRGSWGYLAEKKTVIPALVLIAFPYLAFITKVGGDFMSWYRFILVFIPLALFYIRDIIAADNCTMQLLDQTTKKPLFNISLQTIALIAVASQLVFNGYGHWANYKSQTQQIDREYLTRKVAQALAIRNNTPDDATVAIFGGLGHVAYHAQRPIIDMLGVVDKHIARTKAKPFRMQAHQKDDPNYVMQLKPDYVNISIPAERLKDVWYLESRREGLWSHHENLALNPLFRRNYQQIQSNHGALPIYAKKSLGPQNWTVLPEVHLRH